MTATTRFKKCPLCHEGMSRLHLSDYNPGVSYDSFRGWCCETCGSEFKSETGEKLENFIPKKNEERYQEMIDNIPKLVEMRSGTRMGDNTGGDTRDNTERGDIESNTSDERDTMERETTDIPVIDFTTARNCPYCKKKLITSFRINPNETFTRNFEWWFCLECTCTFSPRVATLLEIRPDDSVGLYGFTEWDMVDDSLVVDPELIIAQLDSLAAQAQLEESHESENQYTEHDGRPIRRIKSLDELV
ncbi:MAG: hypothetical protein ACD_78C00274G0006 [uncultured bacterium (gcode 4)]|uniref:Uncharacterized protein n=1 Tax=uncultured bacterium (gcode 4) TaxID=1234023 RepID=K1YWU9_9BACT|nr:MAG: hypothetical protein ACD_78C00274G0006 [uncultured bacterium (gcode 4)]